MRPWVGTGREPQPLADGTGCEMPANVGPAYDGVQPLPASWSRALVRSGTGMAVLVATTGDPGWTGLGG